ncbi:uncharacterized protein J3D65DRAFT_62685 [Phyllosticta citribraziliensis]|uniref:Uncharacterized protein n=1 Tax=Phyllosticta citribraziliensis TaxID=989973 RepID=A0ABR1LGX6_9PEZI
MHVVESELRRMDFRGGKDGYSKGRKRSKGWMCGIESLRVSERAREKRRREGKHSGLEWEGRDGTRRVWFRLWLSCRRLPAAVYMQSYRLLLLLLLLLLLHTVGHGGSGGVSLGGASLATHCSVRSLHLSSWLASHRRRRCPRCCISHNLTTPQRDRSLHSAFARFPPSPVQETKRTAQTARLLQILKKKKAGEVVDICATESIDGLSV